MVKDVFSFISRITCLLLCNYLFICKSSQDTDICVHYSPIYAEFEINYDEYNTGVSFDRYECWSLQLCIVFGLSVSMSVFYTIHRSICSLCGHKTISVHNNYVSWWMHYFYLSDKHKFFLRWMVTKVKPTLTVKAPKTTAAETNFVTSFLILENNREYHALFLKKQQSLKLSSAAY